MYENVRAYYSFEIAISAPVSRFSRFMLCFPLSMRRFSLYMFHSPALYLSFSCFMYSLSRFIATSSPFIENVVLPLHPKEKAPGLQANFAFSCSGRIASPIKRENLAFVKAGEPCSYYPSPRDTRAIEFT